MYFYFTLLLGLVTLLYSCKNDTKAQDTNTNQLDTVSQKRANDSILKLKELDKISVPEEISYSKIKITSSKDIAKILGKKEDSTEKEPTIQRKIIMALNRKDIRYIRVGDSLLVPSKFTNSQNHYSLFPEKYPEAVMIPKLIIVSNQYQAYSCYEYGKLVRFAPINSGKERTQTYPGRYYVTWKQRLRKSSLNEEWVLPFTLNFHKQAGNAFHEFDMPGRPVSHSCLRQLRYDAEWLFKWARGSKYDSLRKEIPKTGTPVLIVDAFDFRRKKYGPWIDLKSNKERPIKLPAKPLEFEEPYIPLSQIPKESRGYLSRFKNYKYGEDTLRARGIIREGVEIIPSVNFNLVRKQKEAEKKRKNKEQLESTIIKTNE
jgi:hypothetical protein